MRRKLTGFVLLIFACAVYGSAATGQSPTGPGPKRARTPEDYQPRTLKELTAQEADAAGRQEGEGGVFLHGDFLPSRVRVTYEGSTRALPQGRKNVVRQWAMRFAGDPQHYIAPYESEMLFKQDGTAYWLAVNKKLLPQLAQELKEGEAVDLYVIRLGGVRVEGASEWVILAESYRKPQ